MKCNARVQFGNSTYAMRNKDRNCANSAKANGYCHVHQRYANVTKMDRAAFAELRESLFGSATSRA